MGQADGGLALGPVGLEGRDGLELNDAFGRAPGLGVQRGEFLACGRQCRRHLDRLFERLDRLVALSRVTQAQPERVSRLRHARVEAGGPAKGNDGALAIPGAEQRQAQFVLHPGVRVVDRGAPAVRLDGLREAAQVVLDVAHQLGRPDRVAVDARGGAEVPERGLGLAALPVRFSAPEVGDHRVFPECDRSAEGLDGGKRLVRGKRAVAAGDEVLVPQVPLDREAGDDDAGRDGRQQQRRGEGASHQGLILAVDGTFASFSCLTLSRTSAHGTPRAAGARIRS